MMHHPLNGVLPLPLITIIVKSLQKPKAAAPDAVAAAAAQE
jgi:hypothetical protein